MNDTSSDCNLVFGLLALQMSFVNRDELLDAMQMWAFSKQRSLSELMVEMKLLQPQHRDLLEPLVAAHIQRHGNDPQRSLAAISSVEDAVASLRKLNDAELNASLRHVPNRRKAQASEPGPSAGNLIGTVINPHGDPSGDTQSDAPADGLRYRVLRPHAKGGLGEVFVARDTELNREVALKEIQSQFAQGQDNRSRFRQEAEITGNLEHPGIVPVYGLGQYADGRPFYAMRFIRGDSLKEAIEQFHRGPLTPREESRAPKDAEKPNLNRLAERDGYAAARAVEFRKLLGRFIDVCNAIEYAHSRGVLHRDLKPGNIVLGKYGETLVVDWGLAKALGTTEHAQVSQAPVRPLSDGGSTPTMMGSAVGTPAYMSPEQAAGRLDELGPATDVYSLGATLYHVLTGRPPFTGRDLGEILRRVQAGDFPRPREVACNQPERASVRFNDADQINDASRKTGASARRLMIPLPLEAICLKAMSLRASDRYASPLALAEDIERWLADEPVSVYREPLPVRVRRLVRRHQVAVTSLAAAVVVALVGLGVLSAVVSRSNQRLNSANATISQQNSEISAANAELKSTNIQLDSARSEAEQKRDEAVAVNDFLRKDLLGQADIANQEVAHGERNKNITVRELLDRSSNSIEGRFVNQPLVEASVRQTIGDTYIRLGLFEPAERHITAALKILRTKFGDDHPSTLTLFNSEAELLVERGQYNEADPIHRRILDLRQRLLGADHPETLTSMNNLAALQDLRGQDDEAERLYKQVLDIVRLKHGDADPKTLASTSNLAGLYTARGDYDAAEPIYLRILEIECTNQGEDHPDTLSTMHALALLYRFQGKFDKSEELYRRVLHLRREKLEPDNPSTLMSMSNLAVLLSARGQTEEAGKLYQQVFELRQKKLGEFHPDTATSMVNLATAHMDMDRLDDAESLAKRALNVQRQVLGDDHPNTLVTMNNLAMIYESLGRLNDVVSLLKETADLQRQKLGPDHPDTLITLNNLARTYDSLDRPDEAELLLTQVLESRRKKLGEDHIDTLVSMNNLAGWYKDRKRFEEAEPLFRLAVLGAVQLNGIGHPISQAFLRNVLDLHKLAKSHDAATVLLREIADVQKRTTGDNSSLYAVAMIALGKHLVAQDKVAEGNETLTQAATILKQNGGPESVAYVSLQVQWGQTLLESSLFEQAEGKLREAQLIRERTAPNDWSTFNSQSLLGASLAGQKKFADAEPLLLSAYAGLKATESAKKIPTPAKSRPTEALQRLIDLYTAWEKPDQAAEWKMKLDAIRGAEKEAAAKSNQKSTQEPSQQPKKKDKD